MESYLSHTSAAIAWNIPYLHVVLGYPTMEHLRGANNCKEQRSTLTKNGRIKRASAETHYKVLPMPDGSTLSRNGETVASPELVFLDLAKQLGFHRAVLLGMQLCSSSPNRLVPLTSVKRLSKYLDKCNGHHGYKAAAQAARYVADNSWSVMESLLYMLLTLPNQHGGYGLKGAVFNHEILLRERGVRQEKKRLYADLYWQQAKLVVEYDSYQFHNAKDMWIKDARRATMLERNGFNTISINTAQMYSDLALAEVAQVIARYLGQRIQIRSSRFMEQKRMLRNLLPKREVTKG